MKYSIGDKVRFVNENMDGIVSSIIDANTLGVTVDDFEIPVLLNQVVKISFDDYLKSESAAAVVESRNAEKGFDENMYVSFVQMNDQQIELYFVNHTRFKIFVNYYSQKGDEVISKFFQTIEPYDYKSVDKLVLSKFTEWDIFNFQVLVKPENSALAPIIKNLQIPANKFFKHLRATPLLQKQGYLFLINNGLNDDDIAKLTNFDTAIEPQNETPVSIKAPLQIIDLHIDKIHNNYTQLTKQETFQIQLKYFEKNLEDAIAAGMKKITFIHGVGNLRLKNEIVKILKTNPTVVTVQDAPESVFGYGGTEVVIG